MSVIQSYGITLVGMVMSLSLLLGSLVAPAQAQDRPTPPCSDAQLQEATSAYSIGRFGTAFQTLRPCMPDGFSEKHSRVNAWRLLALSYLAVDSVAQARTSVRSLLRVDSRYRPDASVEPVSYVELVHDLKPRWYTWPWKGNEWYKWAGRGLLVSSAIVLPIVLKKEPLPPLPGAPSTPITR